MDDVAVWLSICNVRGMYEQKRSAKDIAFEKERMEFRSEIKHLKKS